MSLSDIEVQLLMAVLSSAELIEQVYLQGEEI